MFLDHDRCYGIVLSRDRRFDGWFVTAVRTTGIYCRPSCPARTPKSSNVSFHPTAAAAQAAGYRACKRCRPDASPGSPEWNTRSDVVARAMRLIGDGVVDRDGVGALARRLGYSDRHLNRLLLAEVGAGALALARSQRAQNARILIETTSMPMVDVAFAAGFASLRQFNDTVREVFAANPTDLRRARHSITDAASPASSGSTLTMSVRLAYREPLAAGPLWRYLSVRALDGVELVELLGDVPVYRRTLRLPRGSGLVALRPDDGFVAATLRLADVRDLTAAVARCRRLLDLDADPVAVDERLAADELLAPLVTARPGLRSPGAVDGFEIAVRAVVGQQISLAGSIGVAARVAGDLGDAVAFGDDQLVRTFPRPDVLAAVPPDRLRMPTSRATALVALAGAVASGAVVLDPGADRDEARASLLAINGIGPWTADYIAMRALGDPDVLAGGDLVVRKRAALMGLGGAGLVDRSNAWAPWRTTVTHHLWAATPTELDPSTRTTGHAVAPADTIPDTISDTTERIAS